jgi:hypothetical protein
MLHPPPGSPTDSFDRFEALRTKPRSQVKRQFFDVDREWRKHCSNVQQKLATFRKLDDRISKANEPKLSRLKPPAGLGIRLIDPGIIDDIVARKNAQWVQEISQGTDPYEISPQFDGRLQLPPERGRLTRRLDPVFYWG